MQITDALLGEHGLFRNLLQTVERLRSESHDLTELRTAAAVLDNALATHSDIEETIFFPALEPHIGDTGPKKTASSSPGTIPGSSSAATAWP